MPVDGWMDGWMDGWVEAARQPLSSLLDGVHLHLHLISCYFMAHHIYTHPPCGQGTCRRARPTTLPCGSSSGTTGR
jgi:hypothetical protein